MHTVSAAVAKPLDASIHALTTASLSADGVDRFFALSPGLMCVAGFDGFFKMLNPAWETVLGFTVDELCATSYLSLVHPDDRVKAAAEFTEMQNVVGISRAKNRFRCKDGSYRWLAWSATCSSEPGLIYASARDVTKSVRLEQSLRASNEVLKASVAEIETKLRSALLHHQELVQLGRFKDVTASMIVHDLKAPLSVILMNYNFVIEGFEGDPECLSALSDSQAAGRRMLALLTNLNDVSRFERGALKPQCVKTTVSALVVPVTEQRRVMAQARRIELLQTHFDDFELFVDVDLITRVLENIVDNALRYTPADGRIEVEAKDLGTEIELRVGNSGVSIPVAMRESIFAKFGQASGSDTGRMNVGLGLYFARLSVEAHRGRIWVEETEALPTVFVMRLPKHPAT